MINNKDDGNNDDDNNNDNADDDSFFEDSPSNYFYNTNNYQSVLPKIFGNPLESEQLSLPICINLKEGDDCDIFETPEKIIGMVEYTQR